MLIPPPLVAVRAPALVRAQMPVLRFQFARRQGRAAVRRLRGCPDPRPGPGPAAGLGPQHPLACSSAAARPACSRRSRSTASCKPPAAACVSRPSLEITLETNPGTAEHGRFDQYRDAGVNRISFGIQSFDDGCLKRLGRIHDSAEAERAVKLAQDAGFDNFNLDLMYALPGQDLAMAEHDLQRAFALQPTHISHYQLTLEPNTMFFARPPQGLPDDDSAWDMQEHCQALLADAGYAQYEVSAYARPGRQCAHNLNYWRFGDYLGIGAGAHGKLTLGADQDILRRWKTKHPTAYLAAGRHAGIAGWRRAHRPATAALRVHAECACASTKASRWPISKPGPGLPRTRIAGKLQQAQARGWLAQASGRVVPTETGPPFHQ